MNEQTPTTNQNPSEWEKFTKEAGKITGELGRALGKTAEDLTGLIVLRTDNSQREQLDLLVKSGAAQTRAEGLKMLAEAGAKAKVAMFKKIEATQAQIDALKKGLKGLVGNG
jgi:hypothetical protein